MRLSVPWRSFSVFNVFRTGQKPGLNLVLCLFQSVMGLRVNIYRFLGSYMYRHWDDKPVAGWSHAKVNIPKKKKAMRSQK
ncbi:hypothetical protein EI94DRAFT_88724 [Lactarius quietus]|nr:hypothetical protein EI94DRAFT_88724 [Lactarius quietus]